MTVTLLVTYDNELVQLLVHLDNSLNGYHPLRWESIGGDS